jgi:competence protein ComEC
VLFPSVNSTSPLFSEWLRIIEEKGITSTVAQAGQRIDIGDGVVMRVLNPPLVSPADGEFDIDNFSVVLRLEYGEFAFLLTGDIGREAEWELVRERAYVASTVLKVAHHGSDTSTTSEFLAVVSPALAVISVGAGNRFGLPDEEVVDRLAEEVGTENVYRTDTQGTIDFTTDGERLWVEEKR